MANITFSSQSQSSEVSSGTQITQSHTIVSGLNQVLLVGTHIEMGSGIERTVTGITFNSVALTKIDHLYSGIPANDTRIEWWRLLNPSVTTANIVVTANGNITRGFSAALAYTGVYQLDPINVIAKETETTTNHSLDITPTVSKTMIVDLFAGSNGSSTITPGGSQTQRINFTGVAFRTGMSERLVSSAAPTVMDWTTSASDAAPHMAIALRPLPSGGGFLNNMI